MKDLVFVTIVVLAAAPQAAQSQTSLPSAQTSSPLLTTSRTLLASLNRISSGSALWQESMKAVRSTGRRVLVVTPSEVVMTGLKDDRYTFDDGALAEAFPVFNEAKQIASVVVVVNLRLLQRLHDGRLSVRRDFEADLDRVLVHEIYGHAVPYLLAGDATGRCADPQKGENASEACSIRRENAVRTELGLGNRADYGLSSLTLTSSLR